MSNLAQVAQEQLKSRRQFTFLGDDGCLVQANDYDGVLAVHITDDQGRTLYDHYTDFRNLLNHLRAHGGHIQH